MPTEPLTNISTRDLLIEHMDGSPVRLIYHRKSDADLPIGARSEAYARRRLILNMIDHGYLQSRVCADGIGMETVITEKGRAALAQALADWADALVRAGRDPASAPPPKPATPLWHRPSTLK